MATCNSYNCDSLGAYSSTLDNCSTFRTGGTSNIVLLACGATLADPTDGAEINALIVAEQAWLIENVKAGIGAGTPVTVDPVTSCGTARTIKQTFTGTIFDAKVNETNTDFWNRLNNGYVIGGMIMSICSTDGLTDIALYIDAEVSFTGGLVSPDVNTELIRYEETFTFNATGYDVITAPTGVWD